MTIAYLIGLAMGFAIGLAIGQIMAIKNLLIGAESRSRTPHCLKGKFYYLVPENEYCELVGKLLKP